MSKVKYTKIRMAKFESSRSITFNVYEKDIDKIKSLRDKGYMITYIKNVEYNVGDYLRLTNNGCTIHSVEAFDLDVHVTIFKNNDYHVIQVPKTLLKTKVLYDVKVHYKIDSKSDILLNFDENIYTSKDLDTLEKGELLIKGELT